MLGIMFRERYLSLSLPMDGLVRVRRKFYHSKRERPIFLFTHHKAGSKLIRKIFHHTISRQKSWAYTRREGFVRTLPFDFDIYQFGHGLVSDEVLKNEFVGVRIIRDPRDIIVSGYLYHKRTTESWANTRTSIDYHKDLTYPNVPKPLIHESIEDKMDYIKRNNNLTYKENLCSLDQNSGLIFEMDGYSKITINSMLKFPDIPNIITIKLEDFESDFQNTLTKILNHVGELSDTDIHAIGKLCEKFDIKNIDLDKDPHISTGRVKKWED